METVALTRSYNHWPSARNPISLQSRTPTGFSAPEPRTTGMSEQSISPSPASRSFNGQARVQTDPTASSRGGISKTTKRHSKRQINYGSATNWEVAQIAGAATAAELYFPPVTGKKHRGNVTYSDGGFSNTNNPAIEGIRNIGERWSPDSVGIVVSVGTARYGPPSESKWWSFRGRVTKWTDNMTDQQPVHRSAKAKSKHKDFVFPYFRFTVKREFALRIGLDEWEPKRPCLL